MHVTSKITRFFYLLISCSLLCSSLPLGAMAQELVNLSQEEICLIRKNNDIQYIHLGAQFSSLSELVYELSALDHNSESPLHLLKHYIESGMNIIEQDHVFELITYIEYFLQDNKDIHCEQKEGLSFQLAQVIDRLSDRSLIVNEQVLQDMEAKRIKRSYSNIATIKGLLSVNDQLVQNITAVDLSVTDATIQNLTIVNNITNITVDSLSVIDGSISGALSVTDEVINNSLTITPFSTAGVVHNNASGLLSSSLIVNADVAATAAIVDTKLATISTAGKVANSATTATSSNTANAIVARDGSGDFSTTMITLTGTVTNATDAATKNYVDTMSLTEKTPALVVGTSNVTLSGLQTIDGVALAANDRVLLINQTNQVENGLWEAQSGSWTRPTDFATGNTAGTAYVLITSGINNAGSSYLCTTPTAIIDTDPIVFTLFSEASATTAANVGSGTGLIFRDKTGVTLNLRSLLAGTHITVTNNTNDITIATDATSANTASAIVARDASGNFSAGTITANLSGNATTATTATNFTGSLSGDVTGTQSATVVSFVGGQTAANVAAATVLANAATNLNTANAIVLRDGTGSFAAQIVSVVDSVASGNLVLSTNPSTSTAGNIMKGSSRFIHNFGTRNTFVGITAGNFTMTGTDNTGIGSGVLGSNGAAFDNTAVGSNAMALNTTGGENTAIGRSSLFNNTTGSNNTAVGSSTLQLNTIGSNNVAVGYAVLSNNTTGNNNTAVGNNAMLSLTTGSSNIAIGQTAGGTLTTGSGNIYIDASAVTSSESSTIRIGTSQTECFIAGITGVGVSGDTVVVDGNGQFGVTLSSERFKHNIQDMDDKSDAILQLRPVTFAYNDDETETIQYGLIAEEVDQVFPTIVSRDEEGKPYTVRYQMLPVLLLNEIQKQRIMIEEMKKHYVTREEMNAALAHIKAELQKDLQ